MNTNFGYIDDDCYIERPITIDNLMLAYSAHEWLHSEINDMISLLETHHHPDLINLTWSIDEIYDVNHIEVCLHLHHSGWERSDDETTNFKIPIEWMLNDQLAIDECKRLNDIISDLKSQQRQYQIAQVKASELAMLATLKEKYGQS